MARAAAPRSSSGRRVTIGGELPNRSYEDIGTLGVGGRAPNTPSFSDVDFFPSELPAVDHHTGAGRGMQWVLNFDLDSAASVNEMVSAPVQGPYLPGTVGGTGSGAPTLQQPEYTLVAIGRKMNEFRNRWQCEFKHPEQQEAQQGISRLLAGSYSNSSSCAWTGPFSQLSAHFNSTHCTLRAADVPEWSQCGGCSEPVPGWDAPPLCIAAGRCSSTLWDKWLFGARAVIPSSPALAGPRTTRTTVSETSDSPYSSSWQQGPTWSTPGSSSHAGSSSHLPRDGSGYYSRSFGELSQSHGVDRVRPNEFGRCLLQGDYRDDDDRGRGVIAIDGNLSYRRLALPSSKLMIRWPRTANCSLASHDGGLVLSCARLHTGLAHIPLPTLLWRLAVSLTPPLALVCLLCDPSCLGRLVGPVFATIVYRLCLWLSAMSALGFLVAGFVAIVRRPMVYAPVVSQHVNPDGMRFVV